MHSATKFIAGHSDLMAGILAVKGERFVCVCVLSFSFSKSGGSSMYDPAVS
jgi:cystathionine beta-lyase/cystathionine gamma-synthase